MSRCSGYTELENSRNPFFSQRQTCAAKRAPNPNCWAGNSVNNSYAL